MLWKWSTGQSFIFPKWHSFKIDTLAGNSERDCEIFSLSYFSFYLFFFNMKPLSVEMACLLGIQNEIKAIWVPHYRYKIHSCIWAIFCISHELIGLVLLQIMQMIFQLITTIYQITQKALPHSLLKQSLMLKISLVMLKISQVTQMILKTMKMQLQTIQLI